MPALKLRSRLYTHMSVTMAEKLNPRRLLKATSFTPIALKTWRLSRDELGPSRSLK